MLLTTCTLSVRSHYSVRLYITLLKDSTTKLIVISQRKMFLPVVLKHFHEGRYEFPQGMLLL